MKITQKQLQNLIDNFGITKTSKKLKIGYLKIKMVHRLWTGSIIFEGKLQIKINLDVSENFSIIRLRASWADSVKESASSNTKTFIWNLVDLFFFRQNSLTLVLIISIPLLSEKLSFKTRFSYSNPKISLVKTSTGINFHVN